MANDIIALAEARAERGRKKGRPPPSGDSTRPMVRLEAGELPRAVDEAEAALIQSDKNLYRFSNKLVTIAWDEIRVAGVGGKDGGKERSLRLSLITAPALLERFEIAARFEKWDARTYGYVQSNCPPALADRYLARDGLWRVPLLRGIVTAPALRADGTILDKPGYDPASGLVFDPLGVEFPAIPDRPTREDAIAALAVLKGPIAKFPFVDNASRSVALSGMLTTVSRAALDAAPMHGFDAPVAGSGKSKLADIAAVMATGHRAAVTAVGRESKGELEKSLSASLLAGDTVIMLDNMVDPVGGRLLNQMLTQDKVKIRIFGKLENREVISIVSMFCNGNNLVVDGDLTRRVLVGRLDPGCERPELLEFDYDPVEMARQQRPGLVTAALTLLRAWIVNRDRQGMPTPLGSFEQWSVLVREALIWLGEADPVNTMEATRGADPKLGALRAMAGAWEEAIGTNRAVLVREVIAAALKEVEIKKEGEEPVIVKPNQDLLDAIKQVTVGKDDWSKSLGRWLLRNKDRVISLDGHRRRFCQGERNTAMSEWLLDDVDFKIDVPF